MVDSGKRKRSSSVRETAQVKRHSPSPSPTPSNASPAAADVPTTFDYTRPLPTLRELQGRDLPKEWYQSIAESGLMEESLRRSREKWLSEDSPIFEKFWTKPLKKRVFNEKINPPKEGMLKIGECEMLIQPHLFEIRLYGVKETLPPPPPPPLPPPPQPQQAPPPPIHHQQPGAPIPGYYYPPHQYPQHPHLPTQATPVPQAQPTHHPQTLLPINAPVPPPPTPHYQPVQRPPPPPAAYPQLPQRPAYMVPGGPLPHPSLHRPGAPSPYVHQQPVPTPAQPSGQPRPEQSNQSVQNGPLLQAHLPPSQADARPNGTLPAADPIAAPPSQLPTPPSSQQGALAQPATTQQPSPTTAPEPTTTTTITTINAAPQQQLGPPPPPNRPDPVIQLLATKAATDPDLKALMRIVAGGNASQEELKIFQQHIDELTPQANAIKARQAEEDRAAVLKWHQEQQERQQHLQEQRPQQQAQFAQPQSHPPLGAPHLPPHNQYPHLHAYHPPPPLVRPRQASAPSVPKIVNYSAIVFEFIQSDHGDRFIFPKNSILEYRDHGCEVLASFLILKTAKNSSGEDVEYYEPITVYLRSQNAKTLEHLQRMVPNPETVRVYMTEIMTKRQRAPKSWPVYRLKRVVKSGHGSDSGAESGEESRRASHTPAPARGMNHTARRRQSSTPGMAEPKAPVSMRTGPRVKVIKKPSSSSSSALHRPTATSSSTSATQSQSSTATPTASSMPPNAHSKPPQPPKPKLPRSRKGRIADPTKSCHLCKTSKTSLWRKAELDGEAVTVCNACGIKWKTQTSRQAANAAAVANGEEPRFGEDGKGVVRKKERQVSATRSGGRAGGGAGSVEAHLPPYGTFMPPQVGGYEGASCPQPPRSTSHPYPENTLPPILSHGQQYPVIASPIPHQTSYPLSQPPPTSARPSIIVPPRVSPPQPSISPLSELGDSPPQGPQQDVQDVSLPKLEQAPTTT